VERRREHYFVAASVEAIRWPVILRVLPGNAVRSKAKGDGFAKRKPQMPLGPA